MINGCDILLRKLLIFKIEGIDAYWDGEVIGKRTCRSYFGRVKYFNLVNSSRPSIQIDSDL